jgi:hypothetical protein
MTPERIFTDDAGAFALNGLQAGRWVLTATASDAGGQGPPIQVFDNATTDLTIEVIPAKRGRRKDTSKGGARR